jgi:hypothetical protein
MVEVFGESEGFWSLRREKAEGSLRMRIGN